MNQRKNDIILIGSLIVIFLLICILLEFTKKSGTKAIVYYDSNLVLTIPLDSDKLYTYEVEGANGIVTIVAGKGKIKVEEENSPLHLCSRQGWVTSSTQTIVCLPNKIVIQIEDEQELDGVVK